MIPSKDDFLSAACRWHGEHCGIGYELSWHGRSDYSPKGTWCWYIFLRSEQFYPDDWARLRLRKEDREMFGAWRRHWAYDDFPDLEAHGGWTFGEMTTYLGREGAEHEQVKVGCDYNHLWDRESGFSDDRESVERDAKRSIDLFIAMFPRRRERCGYSGIYDDAENFYTAKNGRRVHKSKEAELPEGWTAWRSCEPAI